MAAKAPKLFKIAIPERTFTKKILGRTHVESTKTFLLTLYKEEDGVYKRSETLTKEEIKKLNDLAKAIKKNRGSVRVFKLAFVLVLVAAGIIFSAEKISIPGGS